MDEIELKAKLAQIEEQAQLTIAEFPKVLTKERQRMIIALARYVRTDIEANGLRSSSAEGVELDPERTLNEPRH